MTWSLWRRGWTDSVFNLFLFLGLDFDDAKNRRQFGLVINSSIGGGGGGDGGGGISFMNIVVMIVFVIILLTVEADASIGSHADVRESTLIQHHVAVANISVK